MKRIFFNSLLVGVGGFAGSLARYGLALAAQRFTVSFPLGTLGANVLGCLIIGGLAQLSGEAGVLSTEARLLLATGFCGGFTTMSSFAYETAQFVRENEYLHAGEYLALTLAASFAAFYAGSLAVKLLFRTTGGIWN